MRLMRNRSLASDPWALAPDGEPLPGGPVLVTPERWHADRPGLLARGAPVGVCLAPADDVGGIAPDLDRIPLVALDFSRLTEGRGYSQARLLRERHRYAGEIRALGPVQRDQIAFLARCGVDAFEVGPDFDLADGLAALDEISVRYQPDPGPPPGAPARPVPGSPASRGARSPAPPARR